MTRRPLQFVSRIDAVRQLREQLEHGSFPRVQMSLLVGLTAGAGFLASFLLLKLGMTPMGLRWLLACAVGYLCFLGLLGIWIHWRRDRRDFDTGPDFSDIPDASDLPGQDRAWTGGGGGSSGGGASVHFDAASPELHSTGSASLPLTAPSPTASATTSNVKPDAGSAGSSFDLDIDAEAIPVLLLLLVAGLLLSSLVVVWNAPVLFAELLLDGVLAAGLYRRLRHIETRHWLQTAVRKTAWPFIGTALLLAVVGFALQGAVPQADSIGDVLPYLGQLSN